jgi:centrosomal CEP192-like protein
MLGGDMGRITALRGGRRAGVVVLTALIALALALPAIAAACIEDGGGEDRGPLIGAAQIAPSILSFEGGAVVLSGEVEDDCGIDHVRGEVASTEGGVAWSFQLLPVKVVNANTVLYSGEVQLPPNYQGSPAQYLAVIEAEDTNGSIEHAYAGEAEVVSPPPFDEAPYVSGASLTPRVLGPAGGVVTIEADASDNRSVSGAFAIVSSPDGTEAEVQLEAVSSSHFVGRFQAATNIGELPQEYAVTAYAEDDIGQRSSENAGSFVVLPPGGQLELRPQGERFFGTVTIGKSATRHLVVRNRGKRAIQTSIATAAPFSLQGAVTGEIDFVLEPGKTRTFTVEFAPVAPGVAVGSAIVSVKDGTQADISVALKGRGVERRRS